MNPVLSEAAYYALRYQKPQQQNIEDPEDILYNCPPTWGTGYERWIELPGIDLMILAEELAVDLQVEFCPCTNDVEEIELGFNLWGLRADDLQSAQGNRSCDYSFLEWVGVGHDPRAGVKTVRTPGPLLKVDLHLHSPGLLHRFMPNSQLETLPSLQRQIGITADFYRQEGNVTEPMRLAIAQILHCPFQGMVKRLYLESKCLELIALKMHQVIATDTTATNRQPLKPDERDRIHQARAILLQNMASPPSLLALSKQVGLNDHKLKVGFRQEFDTTVFGCLHQHRMTKAQTLLMTSNLNIQEIAHRVGYASRSRFATAFRKQFGVNPKVYRDG